MRSAIFTQETGKIPSSEHEHKKLALSLAAISLLALAILWVPCGVPYADAAAAMDETETQTGPAAAIGETTFNTVAEAAASAGDGDTVILLKDADTPFTIDSKISIDLNGYSFNTEATAVTVSATGDLKVLNSEGTGTVSSGSGSAFDVDGKLTVSSNVSVSSGNLPAITVTGGAVYLDGGVTVSSSGGTLIKASGGASVRTDSLSLDSIAGAEISGLSGGLGLKPGSAFCARVYYSDGMSSGLLSFDLSAGDRGMTLQADPFRIAGSAVSDGGSIVPSVSDPDNPTTAVLGGMSFEGSSLTLGKTTIDGSVSFEDGMGIAVTPGSEILVQKGGILKLGTGCAMASADNRHHMELVNDGRILTDGSIFGNITNGGRITAAGESASLEGKIGGDGILDSISRTCSLGGTVSDGQSFGITQEVTVLDSLVLAGEGQTYSFRGRLAVPTGAELTLAAGSVLTLDGAFCCLDNMGALKVSEDSELRIGKYARLCNHRDASLSADGKVSVRGDVVNLGSMDIKGTYECREPLEKLSLENYGTVNVDGRFIGGLSMKADGSSVSVHGMSGSDLKLLCDADTDGRTPVVSGQKLYIKGDDGVSDLRIGTSLRQSGDGYEQVFVLDGTLDCRNATLFGGCILDGKLTVAGDTRISGFGPSEVAGEVILGEDTAFSARAGTHVTGKLTDMSGNVTGNVFAAAYDTETAGTRVYTALGPALAAAPDAVDLLSDGDCVFEGDLTVTEGTVLNVRTVSGDVSVGAGSVLTVETGARLCLADPDSAEVMGTLVIGDISCLTGTVCSDTVRESGRSVVYTNLAHALETAVPGDGVELARTSVTVENDLLIGEGVTLTIGPGKTLRMTGGSVMTIDGTLRLDSGDVWMDTPGQYADRYRLNGLFVSDIPLDGDAGTLYPSGAYYSVCGREGLLFFISPLSDALPNITGFDGSRVDVYGDTDGTYAVSGGKVPAQLVFHGGFSGELEAVSAEVSFTEGFTGRLSGDGGCVEADVSAGVLSFVSDGVLEVSSDPLSASYFRVSGKTSVGDLTVDSSLTLSGEPAVAGRVSAGSVEVTGNAVMGAGSVLDVSGGLTVLGTVDASAEGCSVSVGDNLYVGITSEGLNVSGSASISGGDVTADGYIAVLSGSYMDERIMDGLPFVEYYVGGVLWLTVYGKGAVPSPVPSSVRGSFLGWTDANGNPLPADFGSVDGCIRAYASLDPHIHTIRVYTEVGLGSVRIDGESLANVSGNLYETAGGEKLESGSHEVAFSFSSGYCGDAYLVLDGERLLGMTFVLEEDGAREHVLNLAGAHASVMPEAPSQPASNAAGASDAGSIDVLDILLLILVLTAGAMTVMLGLWFRRN